MSTKKTLLFATAWMLCVCTTQAQELSLLVHSDVGAPQSFALSSIDKITFSDGKLNVLPTSGAGSDFFLSDISQLTFATVDVSEIETVNVSSFNLYPNPVRDELFVTSDTGIESVTVLGLQGNVLLRSNAQSSSTTLSLGFLPKGIYLIQVKRTDAVSTQKIIKL
ncbi:MAG: T9SS type A sorting domain-containing protein [Candidatus Symbiothrix sp.]|jgi:hypothetical protein|nr:T9SS type A sorting domain-containing protein [Candidatus Symbiothrix sp.]